MMIRDYDFNPPLRLRGRPAESIRTLDEAAQFLVICDDRGGPNRVRLLRQIHVAKTKQERIDVAKNFSAWVAAEGLLLFLRK